jgi:hypothetical protein
MKLTDLKAGDIVHVDDGFPCMDEGHKTVYEDDHGLYVECRGGEEDDDGNPIVLESPEHHYLEGQEDEDGELIGVTK